MNLIKELLFLKEEESTPKVPSFGEMQKKIYAVALPYFMKAQSTKDLGDLSLGTLKYEAENDRFWTSSFDGAHRAIEKFADGRNDLDDVADYVGDAFDEVIAKIFDHYSNQWNHAPGTKLPQLKEPNPIDGTDLDNLIYSLIPGAKEQAEADREHEGVVNAMHRDFSKIANSQRIGKEGKTAVAPWVDAFKQVLDDIRQHGATIAYTVPSADQIRIFARLDTPKGEPIPGAKFAMEDEIELPDQFTGLDVEKGHDYVEYTFEYRDEVPKNLKDLVATEIKKLLRK